jgi:predicted dehydrogenase
MGTSRTLWYRDADYYTMNAWRGTLASGGGALMNQSIHYIDLLQYVMGEVESVSAVCDTLYHKTIEVEDTGIAVIKFKNGAVGSIEGTTIAYPGLFSELNIYGEKGTISIKNDKLDFYRLKEGPIPEFDELIEEEAVKKNAAVFKPEDIDMDSHRKQYEDIVAAVKENREPLVNGEEGRMSLAIINAIYEASDKRKWIKMTYD